MGTLSLDLRERILDSYDHGDGSREAIARRYRVSLGMVKKLLQQRKRTGDIRDRHRFSGRKPLILETHRQQMKVLLEKKTDLTLQELRTAMKLDCTLPAIHYALVKLGLTYKKRHSGPASKTVRTLPKHAALGSGAKQGWIRPS
jgi:transposase